MPLWIVLPWMHILRNLIFLWSDIPYTDTASQFAFGRSRSFVHGETIGLSGHNIQRNWAALFDQCLLFFISR